MFRLFDFECAACMEHREELVVFPSGEKPPGTIDVMCEACGVVREHQRLPSLTQKYLADRPFSPMVHGGRFDTAGRESSPRMPEIPDDASASGVVDFLHSKEWKEWKSEDKAVQNRNAAKRKRAKAIAKDPTIDVRHHKLPGDPNVMG